MDKRPFYNGAVRAIRIYKNDVIVVREGTAPNVKDRTRGVIKEFSAKSRRRLAFTASNTSVQFVTMITLTYPRQFPTDGRKVKQDLYKFLRWLKRDLGKLSVLWFLEFQRRGAPHIHIYHDKRLPRNRQERSGMRFRVSAAWYQIVGSDDERHLRAGTRVESFRSKDGAARYCVKYAMKMEQKIVPPDYRNVGRFWGCTRDVPPRACIEVQACEDDIRAVLEGWEYAPGEDRPVYRILYNQSDRFRSYLRMTIDK
jgi:hypothetical protein